MTILVRTTIRLPYVGGLDRDVSENVWHAAIDGVDPEAEITAWRAALSDFYNLSGGGGTDHAVSEHIAAYVDRPLCQLGVLPIDEGTGLTAPGVSTFWFPFPLEPAIANTALPAEVACCLSFANTSQLTGVSVARRRGRVYIGPLHTPFPTADTSAYSVPHPLFTDDLRRGGELLLQQSVENVDGWTWVIYSRPVTAAMATPGMPERPGIAFPVDSGWVDNEWDTQRRRGKDPTSRVAFLSPP